VIDPLTGEDIPVVETRRITEQVPLANHARVIAALLHQLGDRRLAAVKTVEDGDAVDVAGTADATGAYPTIAPVTVGASHPIFGVVVGFEPDPADLTLLYRKDSTDRYALVCVDPFVIYEIQGSSNAVLAATVVGANGVLIGTHGGSTATGLSGMELSSTTTPASDSTYPLFILGCINRPNNDITSKHAKWFVTISMHRMLPNYSPTDAAYFGAKGV
jgi:hypothetical protein